VKKVKETEGAIRQKNKALIFKAAKKEFVTHGFKGASIKRIAERAGIARANIHYYFKDKTDLYQQILSNIIEVWNRDYDTLNASSEPKAALSAYIRSKQSKVVVIEAWIKEGLIDDVNPHHLLFLIWSSTQHYADFNVQVVAALDKRAMDDDDFEAIVATLTHVILKGCGIS